MNVIFCDTCQTLIPYQCVFAGRDTCPRPIGCPWRIPDWAWAFAIFPDRIHAQGVNRAIIFPVRPINTTGWWSEPE